jgi:hypothetical protein
MGSEPGHPSELAGRAQAAVKLGGVVAGVPVLEAAKRRL